MRYSELLFEKIRQFNESHPDQAIEIDCIRCQESMSGEEVDLEKTSESIKQFYELLTHQKSDNSSE